MKIIISEQCKRHMKAHQLDFIAAWSEMIKQVEQMISEEDIKEKFIVKELDMKRIIGYQKLIKIQDTDEVIYAKRLHRTGYTKFVKNKKALLTTTIVIILNQNRDNPKEYYLVTIFPGKIGCKEPQDVTIDTKQELRACLDFWKQHALIFEEESIDASTIKKQCPYENLYAEMAKESNPSV